jgi:hypothetical protein
MKKSSPILLIQLGVLSLTFCLASCTTAPVEGRAKPHVARSEQSSSERYFDPQIGDWEWER